MGADDRATLTSCQRLNCSLTYDNASALQQGAGDPENRHSAENGA
jgi:hypothetical protein